jgi:hypothetical protein
MIRNRRKIRRIVIHENIRIISDSIVQERRIIRKNKRLLRESNKIALNEFLDVGGFLEKIFNASIDSIKGMVIDGVLNFFGLDGNTRARDIMLEIFENVTAGDLTGIFTGDYGLEGLTDDIIRGVMESYVEDGLGYMMQKLQTIPVVGSLIATEGFLGDLQIETLSNEITNAIAPIIREQVMSLIGNLVGSYLGGGDASVQALQEAYRAAIIRSNKNINNLERKIIILKKNI